jgi:hypothetical protein
MIGVTTLLDKNIPLKKRRYITHPAPFMNKGLRQEIYKKRTLHNKFLKQKTNKNNYCHEKRVRERSNIYVSFR